MKEVKQPKKPLIFYYLVVILALMLFNALVMPWFTQGQIQEVDYGTFYGYDEGQGDRSGGSAGQSDPVHRQG